MPTMLSIGPAHTLVAGTIYALPARASLCHISQAGGTIEQSNDVAFSAAQVVTLDDDEQFLAGGAFIRAVTTNATAVFKAY